MKLKYDTILHCLFIYYIWVDKSVQGDDASAYFLLGGCFAIISTGKELWNKKKDSNE